MFPRRLPAVVALLCFGISMALSSNTDLCTSLCGRPSGVNINTPFPSLEEAELSGGCLTVCGEEVVGTIRQEFLTSFEIWTSIDAALLTDDCPLFFETKECILGCSLRPSASTVNNCRDTCEDKCSESCSFTQSCGGSCQTADCRKTWCRNGCENHALVEDSSGPVPFPPRGFSVQARLEDFGLFTITSVNASQSAPEDGISAFIFKVEAAEETLYVLQSSLSDPLDLSYFSCQEVNLSLAVVNRHGSSQFTPPTPLCVHGGPPEAPENLRSVSVVDDPRPGFLGHAVITVEWDLPEEGSGALTGYALSVKAFPLFSFPDACGNPLNFTDHIAKNATSYVLRAPGIGQLPQFGPGRGNGEFCVYRIELTSLPESQGNTESLFTNFEKRVTSPPSPDVTYLCEKVVDTATGLIGFNLKFNYEYHPLTQEGISLYTLDVLQVEASGGVGTSLAQLSYDPSFVEEMITPVRVCLGRNISHNFTLTSTNELVYGEASVSDLCPRAPTKSDDLSSNYDFTFGFSRNDTNIWWRNLPTPNIKKCVLSGVTERPGVVSAESIRILDEPPLMLVSVAPSLYSITFSLSWAQPLAPYGADEYEVHVGNTPRDTEGQDPLISFRPTVSGETNATIHQSSIPLTDKHQLYVQIRSRNEYFLSSWSEPVLFLNATDTTTTESTSLPGTTIAAIVVVVFFLVLAVAVATLVVFLCVNYRRKKKFIDSLKGDHRETVFLRYRGLVKNISNREILQSMLPMEDEWEIPVIALETEKQLGEGCFGMVFKGFVRGPIPGSRTMKDSIHTTVAIKHLKDRANSSERTDFVNEIDMMKKVAKGGNPHVVSLIGCVTVAEPLCLVIEYLKYGDLLSYLHTIKEELALRKYVKKLKATEASYSEAYSEDAYIEYGEGREDETTSEPEERQPSEPEPQPYLKPVKTEPQPYLISVVSMPEESPYANLGDVEPVNLISFAYQIAAGMEYLSSLEIVHRDLACRNVLVGEGKALKIADFGLSRVVAEGDAYVKTTSGRLPFKWMAIESISDREFTVQSDVWAFGVVLWEIATLGGFPYPSLPNEELREYLLQGDRLEKPPNCADEIYQMMLQCWSVNPAKRPKFSELQVTFESMLMETASYIQFSSLTDSTATATSRAVATDRLPATSKSSNPYVTGPAKGAVTLSASPIAEDETNIRSETPNVEGTPSSPTNQSDA